ncbi:MAG: ATP-binding protein [Acidobacteriota bacterium]
MARAAARGGGRLAWAGLALVFAVDVLFDSRDTVALLYVPVLLLALAVPKTRLVFWLATVATVLTLLELGLSLHSPGLEYALFNRLVTVLVLWVVAAAVLTYRVAADDHLASLRTLEDMQHAIDQSAIVAITDVSGRIQFANQKFCDISKYSKQELLGQDHRLLNSGLHPKEFIRTLWRTIAQGGVWRGELRNRAKDGSLYWVDTTIVPFLDANRKPWQYMAIRYDITARKSQEERLQDQAALAALGEFSAVVAHEVRNPLAGIRNGVQILASELSERSDGVSLAAEIVARIDALNSVISDLLTFARPREFRNTEFDARAFVTQITMAFTQDPAMSGVAVDVTGDGDTTIEADIDQLRLAIMNLLVNAGQAMQGQGAITVGVDRAGDECVITIGDRGPGIVEELRAKIFEPFFTTKARGTGLGLPTVKRVVDAHKGTVAMLGREGGGSVVRIVLPTRQPASAAS